MTTNLLQKLLDNGILQYGMQKFLSRLKTLSLTKDIH